MEKDEKTHSVEKETPLAEMLDIWKKSDGTVGLSKKHRVMLCQENWPFVTKGGSLAKWWPLQGTFNQQKLTVLQHHLEDRFQNKWIIGMFGVIGHGRESTRITGMW